MKEKLNVVDVARICHEANRAYCYALGDTSQVPWADAPDWQIRSAVNGVDFHLNNMTGPADSHANWLKEKSAEGWKYGPVKDPAKKEHPCMVEYHQLPDVQKAKDHLFVSIVRTLEPLVRK